MHGENHTKWASLGLCQYCTRLLKVTPLKTKEREREREREREKRTKKSRSGGKNEEVRQFGLEGEEYNSF